MKDIQREVMRSLEGTESELILDETSFTTTKKKEKNRRRSVMERIN